MSKWDAKISAAILRIKNGWSFSRYSVYKLCPAKARYQIIDKLPQGDAPPLDRGSLIHKQAECYIKGEAMPYVDEAWTTFPKLNKDGSIPEGMKMIKAGVMPPQLARFRLMLDQARDRYKKKALAALVEGTWAFTKDWEVCSPTDWDRCWLRIKVDYAHEEKGQILFIKDWKTGKFNDRDNEAYLQTLQLYSLGGMLAMPHIKEARPSLVYLDQGLIHPPVDEEPLIYTRADIPKLKKLWTERAAPMFADTVFAPRPNDKCRWCAYSKVKGGPCQY